MKRNRSKKQQKKTKMSTEDQYRKNLVLMTMYAQLSNQMTDPKALNHFNKQYNRYKKVVNKYK